NETDEGLIKPTPLIGVLGLIEKKPLISQKIEDGDLIIALGTTKDELGGSEYYEYIHDLVGGKCPVVDMKSSKKTQDGVLDVISKGLVKVVHDCSKGGLAVAVSKLCITNDIGCKVSLDKVPSEKLLYDELLFSESHSRFLLVVKPADETKIMSILKQKGITHARIGVFSGKDIVFQEKSSSVVRVRVDKAQEKWLNSLGGLVTHG